MDRLAVYLHGMQVGQIVRVEGKITFQFDESYQNTPNPPTLSQSFIGSDGDIRNTESASSSGQLPSFFSNLLPEGALRKYIAERAGVSEHREFEMISLLGSDLPGAVVVGGEFAGNAPPPTNINRHGHDDEEVFSFSLAGVQIKFSAIEKAGGGLTIPAHGTGGDWVVKLPSMHYDQVPENEYSMMKMAGEIGIAVPEMRLVPTGDIENLPDEVRNLKESLALVLQRFDRMGGRRIHMEDFAQVFGLRPAMKYNLQLKYKDLTRLVASACREEDVNDFARRLMYNTIIGNGDMHLKNWSFLYPDGKTATLTPAYDYLCTTVYIERDNSAFKIGASKDWHKVALTDFGKVADEAGVNRQAFLDSAVDTVVRFQKVWDDHKQTLPMNAELIRAVERQMSECPAIKSSLPGP